jgi:phage terminase large subunit-like protein
LTNRWLADLMLFDNLKDNIQVIRSEKDILESTKPIWIYTQDFIKRKTKSILRSNRNTMAHLLIKKGLHPNTLVIDEIHLLKPNTQRTEAWFYLSRKSTLSIIINNSSMTLVLTVK